jgi:hypothetical protein
MDAAIDVDAMARTIVDEIGLVGTEPAAGHAARQPAGRSAVACAKKRQIASVASGPRGSV